jgi:hypothetical protein
MIFGYTGETQCICVCHSESILNQLPQLDLPQYFAHGAVLSIFLGAVLWLAGARVSGHEQVSDKYWWVRHYDKRCRRDQHKHS